jgi:hypothetical protein
LALPGVSEKKITLDDTMDANDLRVHPLYWTYLFGCQEQLRKVIRVDGGCMEQNMANIYLNKINKLGVDL